LSPPAKVCSDPRQKTSTAAKVTHAIYRAKLAIRVVVDPDLFEFFTVFFPQQAEVQSKGHIPYRAAKVGTRVALD
jgi:hypothetical protein